MASTLTKKHFQAFAEMLGKNWTDDGFSYRLLTDMADYFQTENQLFDRDRFLCAADKARDEGRE